MRKIAQLGKCAGERLLKTEVTSEFGKSQMEHGFAQSAHSSFVVWLDAYLNPIVSLVGAKALGILKLMKLRDTNFDIPEGFIITTSGYDLTFGFATKKVERLLSPKSKERLEKAAYNIRNRFLTDSSALMSYDFFSNEVAPAYSRLSEFAGVRDVGVAIRSSATLEDLKTKSYAGSYESYLNVRGYESLKKATLQCWASAWKQHLFAKRAGEKATSEIKVAVLVQRMICSDVAGVAFTVDPVSSDHSKICINSSWGLGDTIVSGRVNADIFCVDKKSMQIERTKIGEKMVASRCHRDGGTFLESLSPAMIYGSSLTPDSVLYLAQVCLNIENQLEFPVDIEWAYAGNQLYLLQVRPITTL